MRKTGHRRELAEREEQRMLRIANPYAEQAAVVAQPSAMVRLLARSTINAQGSSDDARKAPPKPRAIVAPRVAPALLLGRVAPTHIVNLSV